MKISLIICTYQRPISTCSLLESVVEQVYKPYEIIIIDASLDNSTELLIKKHNFDLPIKYFLVSKENRGLTKQRNYGVTKVSEEVNIVAYLDDDIILEPNYFEKIVETYFQKPDAIGVGGLDLKENAFFKKEEGKKYSKYNYYEIDNWVRKEPYRYKVRKLLGLMSNLQPDIIPEFSHGRTGFPPNGKIYKVEHLIGMSMSFKIDLFSKINFSTYFEGYGLYEDFDFCVRALKYGDLYVNTNAKVWHYHDAAGRPNKFNYGKMVVRNGWYVWRLKFPNPSFKAKIKWHLTTLLLLFLRFLNVFTTRKRQEAFTESMGRMFAYIQLIYNKPIIER